MNTLINAAGLYEGLSLQNDDYPLHAAIKKQFFIYTYI